MKHFNLFNIEWDTDTPEQVQQLPKEVAVVLTVPEEEEAEDVLADYLTSEYGFTVKGFDYE